MLISLILIISKNNIINFIYLFAFIKGCSQCLYWTNYEIIISDINNKENFKKYFTYDSILNNIQAIIFPILLGLIIENYSYTAVFIILVIITLVSFLLSFTIRNVKINCESLNLKGFYKNIKSKKAYKLITLQIMSDGLTNGGVISMLTTLVIFNKMSSEVFMGQIASVIALICIVVALISERKINNKNYAKTVLPITFLIFASAIPISLNANLFLIVLYRLLVELGNVLTNIQGNNLVFKFIKIVTEEKYKIAYLWHQELALNLGRIIGLLSIILIFMIFKDINALIILFVFFSIFYVIRAILIIKLQNMELKS